MHALRLVGNINQYTQEAGHGLCIVNCILGEQGISNINTTEYKSATEKSTQRRRFLKGATGAVAATAAASSFTAATLSQGRLQWRLVTTWPKKFPGLGTGTNQLSDLIANGSSGRLSVKVYGAKEIVPAFEALDAVSNGTVKMGHGAPYYWKG